MVYAGHIFAHYWIESREKRWLRQAFGQYVSDSLVEAIIASPERLQLGGEEVEATVLFADLVGFSAMAENTAPKELIRLLNEYFSAMTEIILAHRGHRGQIYRRRHHGLLGRTAAPGRPRRAGL